MLFYIHETSCISPQQTFGITDLSELKPTIQNQMIASEPRYENIPDGLIRRMGKAVRIAVGAGLPLLKNHVADGIIIGTSYGGLEDCVKFLIQIIDYEEGRLTPTNFVQSTPNASAAQLSLMTGNKGYNITHTHRGLAFECAAIDAAMLLKENPGSNYLLGGIDEKSDYNYAIESLGGWFKKESLSNDMLFSTDSPGTIPGEGAAMFVVNNQHEGAISKLIALKSLHSTDISEVTSQLSLFLAENLDSGQSVDLLISGENGDSRHLPFYSEVEQMFPQSTSVIRFKHLCGEYPTSTSFALWLGTHLFTANNIPDHLYKRKSSVKNELTLIYNHFKGNQHSFMLLGSN